MKLSIYVFVSLFVTDKLNFHTVYLYVRYIFCISVSPEVLWCIIIHSH